MYDSQAHLLGLLAQHPRYGYELRAAFTALGTSLGILVGLFLSYYLLKALMFSGFKLDFYFPEIGILVAVAVGLLFGILAAMIPARQAANTPIVEALRYE